MQVSRKLIAVAIVAVAVAASAVGLWGRGQDAHMDGVELAMYTECKYRIALDDTGYLSAYDPASNRKLGYLERYPDEDNAVVLVLGEGFTPAASHCLERSRFQGASHLIRRYDDPLTKQRI